jgi:hypothetical protein
MTIELTDEMRLAYLSAVRTGGDYLGALIRDAGLRAVLAIVERDLPDVGQVARTAYQRGQADERALTQLLGAPVTPPPEPKRCTCDYLGAMTPAHQSGPRCRATAPYWAESHHSGAEPRCAHSFWIGGGIETCPNGCTEPNEKENP